ncbi:NAD(P)/FAD-dependent oxidoreductase [Thalassobacillus pellis]|uniref:NAD(P)/FAD-dependent oxidoreductase n=1 Tax=Thalassobacillus pellis TaxID=748008 RepID=UPI001961A760|nr:FAD-dependent oxidoreductase [Thalassobacillus pellis]MBM7554357.1 NADH dehydrogenase FAD-containing subunit [Thalassobacillus pellis]
MTSRMILVGGGNAHLQVLQKLLEEHSQNVEVLLISPSSRSYFSGMLAGFAEGIYTKEQISFDLRSLCKRAGIHFIQKEADRIYPEAHKLVCRDGAVYPFDYLSLDLGSDYGEEMLSAQRTGDKPLIERLEGLRDTTNPLIIGGGAASMELALSIQAYKRKTPIKGNVRLICEGKILPGSPKLTSKKMARLLRKSGVQFWENEHIKSTHDGYVLTDKNNKVRHTGIVGRETHEPNPIMKKSSLPLDKEGFILVNSFLQLAGHPNVFAAGEGAAILGEENMLKNHYCSIRQGEVLWNNILHLVHQEELEQFQPPKRNTFVLSTGFKEGFLLYGGMSMNNKQTWKMKNKMDKSFMDGFQLAH